MFELLQNYFFTGVTGNTAYAILQKFWQKLFGKDLEDLYLDAFEQAVTNERLRLSRYGDLVELDRQVLRQVLRAELQIQVDRATLFDLSAEEFTQQLAEAMHDRQTLVIGGHNLGREDYQQLLRNLIRQAVSILRQKVLANETAFNEVLLAEVQDNRQHASEVQTYLRLRFDLVLEKLETIETQTRPIPEILTRMENQGSLLEQMSDDLKTLRRQGEETPASSPPTSPKPASAPGGSTYNISMQNATNVAIGDGAQVISGRGEGSQKVDNTTPSTMKIALTLYDPKLDDLTDQLTLFIPSKDSTQPRKAEQISLRLYLLNPSDKMARYIQVEMFVKAHFLAYPYDSDPLTIKSPARCEVNKARDNVVRCFLEGGADLVCHKHKWHDLGVVNMQVPWGEADGEAVKIGISYKIEAEEHTGKGLLTVLLHSSANWR
ncbi:MAG: hypothetical protein KJ077_24850 [Anaerolineae bacterium]|nr:hypothetical protein [Anaerolineae bacterium]